MVKNTNGSYLEFVIAPGETLLEVLEYKNISQSELSKRTGITPKHINQIIKGAKSISYATASKLENALGIPASFWNNLEANYRNELNEIAELNNVTIEEKILLTSIPYKKLQEYGYVKEVPDNSSLVMHLRRFFQVSNLTYIDNVVGTNLAFRRVNKTRELNTYAFLAWMVICEIETTNQDVGSLNLKGLRNSLPEIKLLMLIDDINESIARLKTILAKHGIAFAVVRNLPGCPTQGLIKKSSDRVSLCLTIRNKYADIFWFSLFHELGHLLNDDFSNTFVDLENSLKDNQGNEVKADNFASNQLINKTEYERFIQGNITKESILDFAKNNNVLPGVVIGRLQHDNVIEYCRYNPLRLKYEWLIESNQE